MIGKRVYLIRHAQSVYNVACHAEEAKIERGEGESEEYLRIKFDLTYEDCGITPEGVKQCQVCRDKMKDLNVDLVIVSPMRRALMTCEEVFKGHKSNPMIIVDPAFREIYESSCDIGSRLEESMNELLHYDYSLIEHPESWYIDELRRHEDRAEGHEHLKGAESADRRVEAKNWMLGYLKRMWDARKEKPELKQNVLPCVEAQKNKLKELLKKYDSIAVVSHSENIKSYVGYKPPNCAIFDYEARFFETPINQIPKQQL